MPHSSPSCVYVDFWRLGLEREPEKEMAPVS